MYFFTEKELRMMYKKKAFNQFVLEKNQKLTPEARQFLLDRKIEVTTCKYKKTQEKTIQKEMQSTEWMGYTEMVSSEILEAYFLSETIKHRVSKRLLLLESLMRDTLEQPKELNDDNFPIFVDIYPYVTDLEGPLLVKLQKVYGLLCLMTHQFPEFSHGFRKVTMELIGIVETIVGGIDDKRDDVTL